MRAVATAFTLLLMTLVGQAGAQSPPPVDLVKADMLANTTAIQPGVPFDVAIRLTVKPGWHVYWTNPGDAGLPTTVTFTLPDGFIAGSVQYPVPKRFDQPGDVVGYGYEDEVTLLAKITPPATLPRGERVTIKAKAAWLSCADVCVPGKASLAIDLPVTADARPANADLFAAWAGMMPAASHERVVRRLDWNLQPPAGYSLTVTWPNPVSRVEWFPPSSDTVILKSPVVSHAGRTTTVSFAYESLDGDPPTFGSSTALLTYNDDVGVRRGVVVPLDQLDPLPLKEVPNAKP